MKLFIGILIGILLMGFFIMKGWKPSSVTLEPPSPFSFDGDKVTIASWSKFLKHLQIITVPLAKQKNAVYHAVGQIIALSGASDILESNQMSWVELDPQLSKSVGLDLANNKVDTAGRALGLTRLPIEYADLVHVGQTIEIVRYGANNVGVKVQVVKVIPRKETAKVDVVFQFSNGQDWFPGTNCVVNIPILENYPVRIPTTAYVHKGTGEFVWKEIAPLEFEPQSVTVVDSSSDYAWVLGLDPHDHIIGRGGILLGSFLHPIQSQNTQE